MCQRYEYHTFLQGYCQDPWSLQGTLSSIILCLLHSMNLVRAQYMIAGVHKFSKCF